MSRLFPLGLACALALAVAGPVRSDTPARFAELSAEAGLIAPMRSRLTLQPEPARARGTLVMYHGMTAGAWQFDELAERAFTAGYNVYVPRLPGHGLTTTGGLEDPSELPQGWSADRYEAFVERTYSDARALGAPVMALGLSVGGCLALLMAERHPDVQRVVLYAPFLKPGVASEALDTASWLDTHAGGLGGGLAGQMPWSWGRDCEAMRADGRRPGHCNFWVGNVYAAYRIGRTALAEAPRVAGTIQFFVSDADVTAHMGEARDVYRRAGGPRHGWYAYPRAEAIPHAMISPREDRGKGHTPALHAMTMAFLTDGHLHHRGPAPL